MASPDKLQQDCLLIAEKIGYTFRDPALLVMALTHSSYVNEYRGHEIRHSERLEFLGDSVLGLIVSDYLYSELVDHPEGELSYLRSRIVEAPTCSLCMQRLNVGEWMLIGRGESMSRGKGRSTIESDLFEALIGAIYLDGGFAAARLFYLSHFRDLITEIIAKPSRNWKADLQALAQRETQSPPIYTVDKEEGPDHVKTFHVSVAIQGNIIGRGVGLSKKEAEQRAAQEAIEGRECDAEG